MEKLSQEVELVGKVLCHLIQVGSDFQGEGKGAGVLSRELAFVQACTPVASEVFSQSLPVREGGGEGVAALALGGGGCAGRG